MQPRLIGKDFNFFQEVLVNTATWPTESQVTFNMSGNFSFSLLNEGPADIWYSFTGPVNGVAKIHGTMKIGLPSQGLIFDNRQGISGLWLISAGGVPTVVRVESWCHA